jgi:aspartyl protease family protein
MSRIHALTTALMIALAPGGSQLVAASQNSVTNRAFNVSAFEMHTPEAASPTLSSQTPPSSIEGPLESRSESDGLFYVTAMVNGKPVRFVVDTGASVVVLTRTDAIKAGVSRSANAAVAVDTAGGSSAMHSVNLERVDIAGQSLTHVEGAIMVSDLEVSLLGQSVLSQMRSVRLTGNRLQLN